MLHMLRSILRSCDEHEGALAEEKKMDRSFPSLLQPPIRTLDETFFNSITKYFRENAYSSTVSRDLWKHFEAPARKSGVFEATNTTVQDTMEVWVNNSGFPEVAVVRDFKSNTVTVFQYKLQWEWPDKEDTTMLWPHIAPRGAKKEEAFGGVILKSERPSGALFTNSGPPFFTVESKIEVLSPLGTSFH